jgi:hypothetical protein
MNNMSQNQSFPPNFVWIVIACTIPIVVIAGIKQGTLCGFEIPSVLKLNNACKEKAPAQAPRDPHLPSCKIVFLGHCI